MNGGITLLTHVTRAISPQHRTNAKGSDKQQRRFRTPSSPQHWDNTFHQTERQVFERRFSKTNCDIMNGLQALNSSSRSFLGDDVMLLAKAYGSNADDLKHEIHPCKRVLERLKNEEKDSPATLMDYTQFMEQYKDSCCDPCK